VCVCVCVCACVCVDVCVCACCVCVCVCVPVDRNGGRNKSYLTSLMILLIKTEYLLKYIEYSKYKQSS